MIPGQPVLFHPAADIGHGCVEVPFAAVVAYTNEDGTVNLSVLDHAGNQFAQQDVRLLQGGEPRPDDGSAYAYDIGNAPEILEALEDNKAEAPVAGAKTATPAAAPTATPAKQS
jgi:hypothetical protein